MTERPLAQRWFNEAGLDVTETPCVEVAQCLRGIRDDILFDPTNKESVLKARKEAVNQVINMRLCGDNCPIPFPCTLRMLEDGNYNYLMKTFGK